MLVRDIAYKNYKKSNDIHGTVLYPAVMVAPVQKDILADLLDKNRYMKVFDPFHGSGTALYEAAELSDNVHLYGCDINSLANLITKVKLQGVSKNIQEDIAKIKNRLQNGFKEQAHIFPNIQKWFRDDIITDLSKIRSSIIEIENTKNRLYLWYILIDFIRKYSNTRSSTYKLHTKNIENIKKLENNLISEYIASIESNFQRFLKNYNRFTLIKGDTLTYLKDIRDNEYDICITSPPYGNNATTVPYGQFSMLEMYWIDSKDLDLEGWEFENYSIIDSKILGGPFQSVDEQGVFFVELSPYLQAITHSKQRKVLRFFSGYFEFLEQICRITSSYIVMTLGNRTVDGVKIDLTDLTIRYLTNRKFFEKEISKRDIISKRTPKKVSTVRDHPVSSMNEEYVIVMERV